MMIIDTIDDDSFMLIYTYNYENLKARQKVNVTSNDELYFLYFLVDYDYNVEFIDIHITDNILDNLQQVNDYIYHADLLDQLIIEDDEKYIAATLSYRFFETEDYVPATDVILVNLIDQNYEFMYDLIYLKNTVHSMSSYRDEDLNFTEDSKLYYKDRKVGVNLYSESGDEILFYRDLDQYPSQLQYEKAVS